MPAGPVGLRVWLVMPAGPTWLVVVVGPAGPTGLVVVVGP